MHKYYNVQKAADCNFGGAMGSNKACAWCNLFPPIMPVGAELQINA